MCFLMKSALVLQNRMNREDLSTKLAIPLGPRVLCYQNGQSYPIGLTGGYSCETGLLMRLTILKS